MRNTLEMLAVPNPGQPTTNIRTAQLLGTLVSTPDSETMLAVLNALSVMNSGSGNGVLQSVPFTAGSQQQLINRITNQSLMVQEAGEWSVNNAPAVAARATVTRAAVGGAAYILKSLSVCRTCDGTAAPAAEFAVVRDGLTGVGPILWQGILRGDANSSNVISVTGLNIIGSVNTAITIEFTAAPPAGHNQSVTMSGTIAQVAV